MQNCKAKTPSEKRTYSKSLKFIKTEKEPTMTTTQVNTSQSERAGTFTQKVGSTLYEVNVFSGTASRESFEDKILRMMTNDLTKRSGYATMESLQTVRLPGGSV
jgi:hypothetical protein